MDAEQQAWLEKGFEPALDPDQLIVDAHHHLWVDDPTYHLWDRPHGDYTLADLRADTGAGHRVVQAVYIECMSSYRADGPEELRPVGETETVAATAAESEQTAGDGVVIAGIVGFTDLRSPGVEAVLEAHVAAGGGRFRGVRHIVAYDPSPDVAKGYTKPYAGMLGERAFRSGVAALGRAGLSFDAWLYHPQIPELTDLARALPDVPIVLDHLGGPLAVGPYAGHRTEVLETWRASMTDLATCPNVAVKLGGIGNPYIGPGWQHRPEPPSSEELAGLWGDEIRWVIERFGVERCMFESNFPVDRRSVSYTALWNTFKRVVAGASREEKAALFHDTAVRFYRLDPPAA